MSEDFITFRECAIPDARKTRIVAVDSRSSGETLGMIRWYAPWRQYCFYPTGETLFNTTCMAKIVDQMTAMMEAR